MSKLVRNGRPWVVNSFLAQLTMSIVVSEMDKNRTGIEDELPASWVRNWRPIWARGYQKCNFRHIGCFWCRFQCWFRKWTSQVDVSDPHRDMACLRSKSGNIFSDIFSARFTALRIFFEIFFLNFSTYFRGKLPYKASYLPNMGCHQFTYNLGTPKDKKLKKCALNSSHQITL
jgi:hypothetical protein